MSNKVEMFSIAGNLVTVKDAWLRRPARTLGSGPRTRPLFGQDGAGRFVVRSGTVVMLESLPESHVRAAMEALAVRDSQ